MIKMSLQLFHLQKSQVSFELQLLTVFMIITFPLEIYIVQQLRSQTIQ